MPSGFLGRGIGPNAFGGGGAGNGLLNNLIAYWPLNEAGGANNALDLHTNALHLTQNSSPGSAAGKVAAARNITLTAGTKQSFTAPASALLNVAAAQFTISLWMNCHAAATVDSGLLIGKGEWAVAEQYIIRLRQTMVPTLLVGNGISGLSNIDYGSALSIDEWHHILAWKTETTINISVDGGAPATTANTYSYADTTKPLRIGYDVLQTIADTWNIDIDEVAIWNLALSEAQRAALWNGGAGLAYEGFTA